MSNDKLRRQIAFEAARLMYGRQESEYYRAKLKAGKRICGGWVKPPICPATRKSATRSSRLRGCYEGDGRLDRLREMRLEALRLMRILAVFRPRLIGSTMTGHVRAGSDIDIHLFADSSEAVTAALEAEGMVFDLERKRVRKHGEERVFTHVHVRDRFNFELTIYAANLAHFVFKSSITGKPIERASVRELEQLLRKEYPRHRPRSGTAGGREQG